MGYSGIASESNSALLHTDMNGQYHSPAAMPKGNEPHVPKAGRGGRAIVGLNPPEK